MRLKKDPPTEKEPTTIEPLSEYFIWWDEITPEDVEHLKKAIHEASNEHHLQYFLEINPLFLIQHFRGGHGRWVIPQKKLGAEFIPDFVIGHRHSFGFEWQAVELKSPKAKMFNKNGDISSHLNHAIRQILDWRAWLKRNIDYASRPEEQNGLGLIDISGNIPGLILIGRRVQIDPLTNDRRRQMVEDLNIEIHSYDYLIDMSHGRVDALIIAHKSTQLNGESS